MKKSLGLSAVFLLAVGCAGETPNGGADKDNNLSSAFVCDESQLDCPYLPKLAACPEGETYAIEDGCYSVCVPVEQCAPAGDGDAGGASGDEPCGTPDGDDIIVDPVVDQDGNPVDFEGLTCDLGTLGPQYDAVHFAACDEGFAHTVRDGELGPCIPEAMCDLVDGTDPGSDPLEDPIDIPVGEPLEDPTDIPVGDPLID